MNCRQVRQSWTEPAPPIAAAWHLESCPRCRKAWEQQTRMQSALDVWQSEARVAADLTLRLRRQLALEAQARRPVWHRIQGWFTSWDGVPHPGRLRLAAASGTLLIAICAGILAWPHSAAVAPSPAPARGVVRDLQALNHDRGLLMNFPLLSPSTDHTTGADRSTYANEAQPE